MTVAGLETIQPAGNLKPVTLELCGKGSRVILDDADLVIDGSLYDSLISGSGSLVPATDQTSNQRGRDSELMPHYQFFIQSQSNTALRKAAIAEAFTEVHTRITGAPASYVNCTFVEVEAGSIYVGGDVTEFGRMVGIIRRGRTEEVKRQLLTELAHAWSTLAQEPLDKLALFLHEIPGYQAMEYGEILREASEDHPLVSGQ